MRTNRMLRCQLLLLPLLLAPALGHAQDAAAAKAPVSAQAPKPARNLRLLLPKEIPAVVGVEANIYFDNVVLCRDTAALVFDVDCRRGRQQVERWTFTPTAKDVGKHPLTLKVCNETMRVIAQAETTVRVVPADAGKGRETTVLCIGDSLTAAGYYPERIFLASKQAGAAFTMIGTAPTRGRAEGSRHEGYGGWTFQRFVTMATKNPEFGKREGAAPLILFAGGRRKTSPFMFWDGEKAVFDFPRYVKEQCNGRGPDFVTIALGCNDTFSATEETIEERIDKMFGYADPLVAGIHAARADTEIGIVSLVPPAGTQDAFGQNYRCGQTRWQYRRNQHRVVERMMAKYGGREAEHIYFVPAYLNLDTMNGYPTRAAPAFAHATAKVARLSNGVHPAKGGYYQMGDSIYAWIRGKLAD